MLLRCEVCGAQVTHLRRGRCSVCYLRWVEARPVPQGSSCIVCRERRQDYLRQVEFQRSWLTMCHNCAGRTATLRPAPRTVEALRQRMERDRRWNERRDGAEDSRLSPRERRNDDRRHGACVDEPAFIDADDLIIEMVDADEMPAGEYTRIAPRAEIAGAESKA